MRQPAIFLDRDGTLVHPEHYPSRPEQMRPYKNIGPLLRELQEMGFSLVMITNQAGIAHGYFSEDDLQRMHTHLQAELAADGVSFAGIYYCPHHPDGIVEEFAQRCDCRKPEPGMLLRAATELELDLQRSWFVGDILDDIEAGNRAGCHTLLIDLDTEGIPTKVIRTPTFVASDTRHALNVIKSVTALASTVDLLYRPAAWRPTSHTEASTQARSRLTTEVKG